MVSFVMLKIATNGYSGKGGKGDLGVSHATPWVCIKLNTDIVLSRTTTTSKLRSVRYNFKTG